MRTSDRRGPRRERRPRQPLWNPASCHTPGATGELIRKGTRRFGPAEDEIPASKRVMRGAQAWRERRGIPDAARLPGLQLVLVHTVAHALMRRITLECGYSHASIRERLYAYPPEHPDGPMAGVLLYMAASDSEGTLGGLVALGEPDELGRHLRGALIDAGLMRLRPALRRTRTRRRGDDTSWRCLPRLFVCTRDLLWVREPLPRPRRAPTVDHWSRRRLPPETVSDPRLGGGPTG
jgi:hypothetical protein